MWPDPSPYLCPVSLSFLPSVCWGGRGAWASPTAFHEHMDTTGWSRDWKGDAGAPARGQGTPRGHTCPLPLGFSSCRFPSSCYSEILNVCLNFESRGPVTWDRDRRREKQVRKGGGTEPRPVGAKQCHLRPTLTPAGPSVSCGET